MKTMMEIGTNKESLMEIKGTILQIINSHNAEAVKIKALEVFKEVSKVENINITQCSFINNPTPGGKGK